MTKAQFTRYAGLLYFEFLLSRKYIDHERDENEQSNLIYLGNDSETAVLVRSVRNRNPFFLGKANKEFEFDYFAFVSIEPGPIPLVSVTSAEEAKTKAQPRPDHKKGDTDLWLGCEYVDFSKGISALLNFSEVG